MKYRPTKPILGDDYVPARDCDISVRFRKIWNEQKRVWDEAHKEYAEREAVAKAKLEQVEAERILKVRQINRDGR